MERLEWHILKCIDFKLGVGAKDGHTAYDLLEREACCGKRHPAGREGREGREGGDSDDDGSSISARKGRKREGSLRSLNCLVDTLASGGKDAPSGVSVSNSNNGAADDDDDKESAAAAELLWRRRIFVHHCAVAVLPMGAPGCSPAAVVRVADHRRALVSGGGDDEEEALEAAARSCAAAVDAAVSWFYASSFVSLGRMSEDVDWWTSSEGDAEGDGEGGGEESAGWREKCWGRKRQRRAAVGDRP